MLRQVARSDHILLKASSAAAFLSAFVPVDTPHLEVEVEFSRLLYHRSDISVPRFTIQK